ncbi:hypothetical protein JXA32_09055 [Candidatus Sumerlaeota bacterium]|nr:hypothetical protein [Candidatus Sumerlaeota bacterium]
MMMEDTIYMKYMLRRAEEWRIALAGEGIASNPELVRNLAQRSPLTSSQIERAVHLAAISASMQQFDEPDFDELIKAAETIERECAREIPNRGMATA